MPGSSSPSSDERSRLACRRATRADLSAVGDLMEAAISELQKPFLDDREIESSRAIMGVDTQLVDDGTYYIVQVDGNVAGCGGWSRRATLYGGDHAAGRRCRSCG